MGRASSKQQQHWPSLRHTTRQRRLSALLLLLLLPAIYFLLSLLLAGPSSSSSSSSTAAAAAHDKDGTLFSSSSSSLLSPSSFLRSLAGLRPPSSGSAGAGAWAASSEVAIVMVDTRDILAVPEYAWYEEGKLDPFWYGLLTAAANHEYACKVCMV
jgi:hypothetical protein